MKPATPERDIVLAQLARLQAISAGADWHTDLGDEAHLSPLADERPPLHCWPSLLATDSDPESGAGICVITWTAVIPIEVDDSESTDALYTLADMRAALVSLCAFGTTHEAAAELVQREPGSNYATVNITVTTPIIIEGRANG